MIIAVAPRTRRVGHWANSAFAYFERLSFSAMRTRSATMRMPSFSIIRLRWTFMVFSTVPSIAGNLLVEPPRHDMRKHFAFARGQGTDLRLHRFPSRNEGDATWRRWLQHWIPLRTNPCRLPVWSENRSLRLSWHARSSECHLCRNEQDRTMGAAGGGQHALNLQAIKTWHRNIQHGASGNRHVVLFEEHSRRRIWLDLIIPWRGAVATAP